MDPANHALMTCLYSLALSHEMPPTLAIAPARPGVESGHLGEALSSMLYSLSRSRGKMRTVRRLACQMIASEIDDRRPTAR